MRTPHFLSILLSIIAMICFVGCESTNKYSTEFFSMDTVMTITAYGENCESAVKLAQQEIENLDSLMSIEDENSEIYKLNRDKTFTVSQSTCEIIERAYEFSELTEGDFDITVTPLVRTWGFYTELKKSVPTQDMIEDALSKVDYRKVQIGKTVILGENTEVDLGGIAKGYASHRAMQILKDNGVKSAILSLGGNIRAVGTKKDGSRWTVAITDPDDNSRQIGYVSVKDCAVVTSGGYQRFFEDNGQIYHHIIDTKTGYPAKSGLKSVTVVSEDDTLADALSTALYVKGLDEATEFYRQNRNFEAVFVTDSGQILVTSGLANSFTSDRSFEVIDI